MPIKQVFCILQMYNNMICIVLNSLDLYGRTVGDNKYFGCKRYDKFYCILLPSYLWKETLLLYFTIPHPLGVGNLFRRVIYCNRKRLRFVVNYDLLISILLIFVYSYVFTENISNW